MTKHLLITVLCLLNVMAAIGKPVEISRAKTVAESFFTQQTSGKRVTAFTQKINLQQLFLGGNFSKDNLIYVFNISTGGFVIVSGDDVAYPILGYSTTGSIEEGNIPQNMEKWLYCYVAEIENALNSNQKQSELIADQWTNIELLSNSPVVAGPLLKTEWNQAPLYNKLCPFDNDKGELTVTGCVATGMAQVIKYWGHLTTGFGFHSYSHSKYGTLSANFQNTTYDFMSMPNTLTASSTQAEMMLSPRLCTIAA